MMKRYQKLFALALALVLILGSWTSLISAEELNPPTIVRTPIEFNDEAASGGRVRFDEKYNGSYIRPENWNNEPRVGYIHIATEYHYINDGFAMVAKYDPIPYLPKTPELIKELQIDTQDGNYERYFKYDFATLTHVAGDNGHLKEGEITDFFFVKNATNGLTVNYNLRFQDLDTPNSELGGFTHPTPVPDEGYRFVGWKLEGAVSSPDAVMTGDVKAIAQFEKEKKEYTIIFDANGGTFSDGTNIKKDQYASDTIITIADSPTRQGYKFLYWEGSQYDPGDRYTVTEDHTFTAKWEEEPITIFARPINEDHTIIIPLETVAVETSPSPAPPVPAQPSPQVSTQNPVLPATGSVSSGFSVLFSLGLAMLGLVLRKRR